MSKTAISQKRLRLAAMAAAQASVNRTPEVAITGLSARAVREPVSGRTYLIVYVDTDAGVRGIGEAMAGDDPTSSVGRILALKQALLGQDALAPEALRLRVASASKGPADGTTSIQSALDMALLDILGKVTKAPLFEVLAGSTRQKARALAPLHGPSAPELKNSLQRARESGFRAFIVPLQKPMAFSGRREFYKAAVRLLEELRFAAGEESSFVVDCGGQLTASDAATLSAELQDFHLLWLEEPTAQINNAAFAKLANESVTPVGFGRSVTANSEFQDLLRMDAVDVLRPDVRTLGVSLIRRAAALAETYYVAVAPFHRGGPVGTAAALHIAASIPNFFIQEVPVPADGRDVAMRRELSGKDLESPEEGFLRIPAQPGLGIELNEDAVHQYEVKS